MPTLHRSEWVSGLIALNLYDYRGLKSEMGRAEIKFGYET
jgi:hypothetical protein